MSKIYFGSKFFQTLNANHELSEVAFFKSLLLPFTAEFF